MTIQNYAIVDGQNVSNVILLDTDAEYIPPTGCILVPAPDHISIGWQRSGSDWYPPENVPIMVQPTEDPDILDAKYDAVAELVALGVSVPTARRIVGLPLEV